jgi:hypothetical protein
MFRRLAKPISNGYSDTMWLQEGLGQGRVSGNVDEPAHAVVLSQILSHQIGLASHRKAILTITLVTAVSQYELILHAGAQNRYEILRRCRDAYADAVKSAGSLTPVPVAYGADKVASKLSIISVPLLTPEWPQRLIQIPDQPHHDSSRSAQRKSLAACATNQQSGLTTRPANLDRVFQSFHRRITTEDSLAAPSGFQPCATGIPHLFPLGFSPRPRCGQGHQGSD